MTDRIFPWLMVGATVLLTSYGQLVLKWQSGLPQEPLPGWLGRLPAILQMLARPWVLSAFAAAFGASLCWMIALSKLELSRAYPFMALNFVLVTLVAVPVFNESLTFTKLTGLGLVIIGLVLLNQGAP